MSRRHIAVLTGKRGGYGAMKPMLRAIDTDPLLRLSRQSRPACQSAIWRYRNRGRTRFQDRRRS